MSSTRMAPADAAWFHMDRPHNLMIVNIVLRFDGVADREELAASFMERVVDRFPVFRARAVEPMLTLGVVGPRWQAVDVRAEDHLRHVTLPHPGGASALQGYIAEEAARPLDPDLPLWQLHLLDRVGDVSEGGEGTAILLRTHHALGDGPALMHVIASWAGQPPPAAGRSVRTSAGSRVVSRAVSDAGTLTKLVSGVPSKATVLAGQMRGTKAVSWTSPVPLDELRQLGQRHGATLNDVGLALLAGALRGAVDGASTARDVQAAVPVTLRDPAAPLDRELGNRFGLVFVELPTTEVGLGARITAAKAAMDRIKATREARTVADALTVAGTVPRTAAQAWIDAYARRASVIATNINGPRQRLVLGSAVLDELVLFVPSTGPVGVGVSLCSYAGTVRFGVVADTAVLPDVPALVDALDAEVAAAVGSGVHPHAAPNDPHGS